MPNKKSNEVIYGIIDYSRDHCGLLDLTGRFPLKSAKSNEYILVAHSYDTNTITSTP